MSPRRAPLLAVLALFMLAAALPARAQFRAGPEFRVNSYTTFDQGSAFVAMEPEGEFVIVWHSRSQDGSSYGVFGRPFREDGSPRGPEFQVNTYTFLGQTRPFAAHDGNELVVVWTSEVQDGGGSGVFGRRFDKDGTPGGPEFRVNVFTTGEQRASSVAKDRRGSRGGFVVVWTDYGQAGGANITARRYDERGQPVTGDFLVNAYTTGSQTEGRIAMTGDGRFVVVWTSYPQDGSLQGVFGRRFGPSGNPLGAEFQVNTITTGAQYAPAVDVARDGSFVVAWLQSDGSDQGVFAQRFDAAGTRVGSELQVNTFTTNRQRTPAVSTNERGDFVVVWESFLQDGSVQGIFGQRFDRNGTRVGGEFQVNAYTTGLQWNAHVDADEVGNFTVAWGSLAQDGDSFGVYAQRFGGILFTALGLDATPTLGPYRAPFASDGNGVLEPGEVVTVETSWTNVSGLAQTLTGFVSSFTGPPGPTYSVPDAFADFGVIPHGATVSCAVTGDCYRLGVSGTRPATHWDGVMTEGPTNIILGQAKLWDIHVGDSFTDVPRSSPYYRFIETLLHHGITGGCAASEYCPQGSTTREQMAVFVTVAASGPLFVPPACGAVPLFADVPPASPYCRWVEELARRGVVAGCGGGNYCPSDPVSREQMAVFVLRALDGTLDPPACTTPLFADVPASSPFCRWVEELARRGVVTGCGGGNYCPADPVTREQMGVFITATFGLALYGM